MSNEIKKIGILTSGGDAPGMNAAIRAVARTAIYNNIKVIGIRHGYEGLLNGDFIEMNSQSVANIMFRGGTMLFTARSKEMNTPEGEKKAAEICKVLGLDALVVIGGDGSLKGARALSENGVNVVGIPGTIDLDLPCSEYTIGFDTAVNTALDCINKIRDTSCSHERCSVVEVMGNDAGFLALWTGVCAGCEEILIPEKKDMDKNAIIQQILENRSVGKKHNMIIVAEGIGGSQELSNHIQEITGIQTRATILGHIQRGGTPTAKDRLAGSIMGHNAVQLLVEGRKNRVVVMQNGKYTDMDINEALKMKHNYDDSLYQICKVLSV